jgi:hypothetical protein
VPHSPPILLPSHNWWTVYSIQYTVCKSAARNAVSCYLLLLRLLCAVRSHSARVRGGRDVSSMQISLTVSGDDIRDQLLSHLSGLTLKRKCRRVQEISHSSLWRRMGECIRVWNSTHS